MIKISKLADYALQIMQVLMTAEHCLSAAKCAEKTKISVSTVSKVLKILTDAGIVISEQGAKGGYQLSRLPQMITLAQLVTAVDGPLALTECSKSTYHCPQDHVCGHQRNWQTISQIIFNVLDQVSLKDMSNTLSAEKVQVLQFVRNK